MLTAMQRGSTWMGSGYTARDIASLKRFAIFGAFTGSSRSVLVRLKAKVGFDRAMMPGAA